MKSEVEKAVKAIIEEKMEQVIVAIRASHPGTNDIKELSRKLDSHIETHERDTKAINEKLDPIARAYSNVTGFRATVITVATLAVAGWGGYEAIKKILGK